MSELTHLSLCTGIGGIDLAAEWAGFTTVGQCEIDDYASRVLAKNFKGVPNLHDIRTVDNPRLREHGIDPERITLMSAGFPCQPYSLAGKGRGDGDERDLRGEVKRCIGEIKPRWFVGENTPGCLPELIKNTSSAYLPTLPKWGTECHGEYGELAMSERLTSETECSCALGTSTAYASKRSARFKKGRTPNPAEFAEKFPTSMAKFTSCCIRKTAQRRYGNERSQDIISGLSP